MKSKTKQNDKTSSIDDLRTEYLNAMTELSALAVDRQAHLPDATAMNALRSFQEEEESKKMVVQINQRIAEICDQARFMERLADRALGIAALFESDVPNPIRVLAAILIGKSLAGQWTYECRSLGSLLLPAAGNNVAEQLAVREAFSSNGVMRKHIHGEIGRTLDEMSNLTFKESAFRRLLALKPDSECDDMMEARIRVAIQTGGRFRN